jgi:hypothetical protein
MYNHKRSSKRGNRGRKASAREWRDSIQNFNGIEKDVERLLKETTVEAREVSKFKFPGKKPSGDLIDVLKNLQMASAALKRVAILMKKGMGGK